MEHLHVDVRQRVVECLMDRRIAIDQQDRIFGVAGGVVVGRIILGDLRRSRSRQADRLADDDRQFVHVPRLVDEAEDFALIDRRQYRLQIGITGQQNPHRPRCDAPRRLQHFDPGHARHALIADDDVEIVLADQRHRRLAAAGGENVEVTPQQPVQCPQDARFVVDAEDLAAS